MKQSTGVNIPQKDVGLNPIAKDKCTSDFIKKLYNQSLLFKQSGNNIEAPNNVDLLLDKKLESRSSFECAVPIFLKPLEYPVTSKEFLGNKRLTEENIHSGGELSLESLGANHLYRNNPYSLISPSTKTNKVINYNQYEPKNLFHNSNQRMNQFSNPNEINFLSQNLNNNFLNTNCLYSNSSYINMNAFHQFENLSHNSFDPKQYFFFSNSNFTLNHNNPQNKEEKSGKN
jgi:hypothetical protein